jgi:hypothetical protein
MALVPWVCPLPLSCWQHLALVFGESGRNQHVSGRARDYLHVHAGIPPYQGAANGQSRSRLFWGKCYCAYLYPLHNLLLKKQLGRQRYQ